VTDYPLDDGLLVALRSARPDLGANESDADDPEALGLLERILSSDIHVDRALRGSDSLRVRRQGRFARPRVRLMAAIAALVLVALVVPLVVTSTQNPNSTGLGTHPAWRLVGNITQPGWQLESTPSSDSESVACPTVSTCYAVGISAPRVSPGSALTPAQTVIEVTRDGGATWSPSVPAPGVELGTSLSCPGSATCMIAGAPASPSATDHLYITIDGGQSWTSNPMPTQSEGDVQLSCTSATACVAEESRAVEGGHTVGSDVFSTTNGGRTWTTSALPNGFTSYSLQCSADGRCVIGGDAAVSGTPASLPTPMVLYSTDGGVTWSPSTLPPDNGAFLLISSISCGDSQHCMAVEPFDVAHNSTSRQVLVSSNGGVTWTVSPYSSPTPIDLYAISCPTITDCWATGVEFEAGSTAQHEIGQGYIMTTDDGGSTWTPQALPAVHGAIPSFVSSISCAAANACSAVAQAPDPGDWTLISNEAPNPVP
jgi:photosystem II stability/assembly factor-like uncharacterized protein